MLSPPDTETETKPKPRRRYTRRSERRLRFSPHGIKQPDNVDGRSRLARRFRKISEEIAAEIAADGYPLSPVARVSIERATTLLLQAETEANPNLAIRLCSEGRRLLDGLRPKGAKKAKPSSPLARILQGAAT
jgi:hypothetical protein